jgi:hypothetical protein
MSLLVLPVKIPITLLSLLEMNKLIVVNVVNWYIANKWKAILGYWITSYWESKKKPWHPLHCEICWVKGFGHGLQHIRPCSFMLIFPHLSKTYLNKLGLIFLFFSSLLASLCFDLKYNENEHICKQDDWWCKDQLKHFSFVVTNFWNWKDVRRMWEGCGWLQGRVAHL